MKFIYRHEEGEAPAVTVFDDYGVAHRVDYTSTEWNKVVDTLRAGNVADALRTIKEDNEHTGTVLSAHLERDSFGEYRYRGAKLPRSFSVALAKADEGRLNAMFVNTVDEGVYTDDEAQSLVTPVKFGRDDSKLAIARFIENLGRNPKTDSVEQLFDFVQTLGIGITKQGKFIAFKGVNNNLTSKHAGKAFVKVPGSNVAVLHNGNIPNNVGNVISMNREDVTYDPNTACGPGLHAGSWGYATMWGDRVLIVEVDPADVVSVPNDHNHEKLRAARYRVLAVTEQNLFETDDYEYDYDDFEAYDEWEDDDDYYTRSYW